MNPGTHAWHYRPGPHWVVVAPTAAALLVGEEALELAERLWRLLDDPDGAVDRVLDELARRGLAGLPPFALVEIVGSEVRAFARGSALARVRAADDTHRTVAGAGVRSWREDTVTAVVDVLLTDAGADEPTGPQLPVGSGIVRASELALVVDDSLPGSAQPPPAIVEAVPRPLPAPEEPVEAEDTLDDSDFDPDHGRHAATPAPGAPAREQHEQPRQAEPAEPAEQDEDDPYLDLVVGSTELGTSAEVVQAPEPLPVPEPPAPPVPPPPAVEPAPVHRAPPPTPTAPGLISSIPFRSGRATRMPAAQPEPPSPVRRSTPPPHMPPARHQEDDDTDITVMKVSADPPGDGSSTGRTGWLPAAVCGSGHANPPEAERCRVCRADLSAAAHQLVERPVLGRLRFDRGHGPVEVTGPMVIGRRPRADRVPGNAVPAMIAIPDDDISKSHLRVVVQGWHVVVEDLGSTNGTWTYGPDGEGRRLDPDEERLLVPGSRVVMADSVGFVYEVQP